MTDDSPRKTSLRRRLRRLALWPLRLLGYALIASVLWVAAYTVIDPPGGYGPSNLSRVELYDITGGANRRLHNLVTEV